MKYFVYISFFLLIYIFSCGKSENTEVSSGYKDSLVFIDTNKVTVYDTVRIPVDSSVKKNFIRRNQRVNQDTDYIPPRNGGVNKYWYGNRNRKLSNDSNCYFGKGKRHRYRHGWRKQN